MITPRELPLAESLFSFAVFEKSNVIPCACTGQKRTQASTVIRRPVLPLRRDRHTAASPSTASLENTFSRLRPVFACMLPAPKPIVAYARLHFELSPVGTRLQLVPSAAHIRHQLSPSNVRILMMQQPHRAHILLQQTACFFSFPSIVPPPQKPEPCPPSFGRDFL